MANLYTLLIYQPYKHIEMIIFVTYWCISGLKKFFFQKHICTMLYIGSYTLPGLNHLQMQLNICFLKIFPVSNMAKKVWGMTAIEIVNNLYTG